MRYGTGKALWATLLAMAMAMASLPAAAAAAGHTTWLGTGHPGLADGATTADSFTIFTVTGTASPGRISVYVGPSGRLTLVSPEGIAEPDGDAPECTQDTPTQVSCLPGFIDVVAGDLKAGADTFIAAPTIPTMIGADLVGPDSPLSGGGGRDRITGGLGNDLLDGGAGPDFLSGGGGSDVLRGGFGRDNLMGGAAPDALFGGSGADKLNGGAARDLCNGGGGPDLGISCDNAKKIP
jgi:Ca2+-binding RTX toxin-like protein